MKIAKVSFLLFLLIMVILSTLNVYYHQSILSYLVVVVAYLTFVKLYSNLVFGLNITTKLTSKLLSLEQSISELDTKQKELKQLAIGLVRHSMLYTEGSGFWGKTPDIYEKEIDKTLESLSSYLPPNFIKDIKNEIKQLDAKVKNDNES